MQLIANWRNKNLKCYFCGETRSVKYTVEIFNPVISDNSTKVCCCNKCAPLFEASKKENN